MSDYEDAMTESGWSGCCPVGWSWMLEGGGGEPVLCWCHENSPDIIQAFDGRMDDLGQPFAMYATEAMQAGSLWQRYVTGVEPTAGPA